MGEGAGWDRLGLEEVHKGKGAPPWGAGAEEAPRMPAESSHTPRTPQLAPHKQEEGERAPRSRAAAPRRPRQSRFSQPQLSQEADPGHCSLHCNRGSSQPPRKTRRGIY